MKKGNGCGVFWLAATAMTVILLFWQEISVWGKRYHAVKRYREEEN